MFCNSHRLYCAAVLGTGIVAYHQYQSKAEMKEIMQLKNYMANPITPVEQLEQNKDDMKTQMELLIMRIQAEFCRALEKEEDKVNFVINFKYKNKHKCMLLDLLRNHVVRIKGLPLPHVSTFVVSIMSGNHSALDFFNARVCHPKKIFQNVSSFIILCACQCVAEL